MTDEAPDQTMEFMCTRCNASFMACSCPREWLENRARWIAADAEIARLREEVARLQRERDEARAVIDDAEEEADGEYVDGRWTPKEVAVNRGIAVRVRNERDEARTSLAAALAERDALAVRVREAEAREKFCHEMLDTNHGWGPGEHLHARVSQVLAELREAQGGQGGMSGGDREALRDAWLYFAGGGHQTDGVKWRDALLRVITGGTPAAAPRTVTREQLWPWVRKFSARDTTEGFEWGVNLVEMLADLGVTVAAPSGEEPTSHE